MSYQIFNEASLGKFIEIIQNKVRSIVDNATVASAQKATNDSDGNAINTTYRKVADSYSKTEVDNKVDNSPKSITITTDDLIANYTFAQLKTLLESGNNVYLKTTKNDLVGSNFTMDISYYQKGRITWACQYTDDNGVLYTILLKVEDTEENGSISFSEIIITTNTLTFVSTVNISVAAWDSTSKTAKVSVSGVTFDNAVDVAPAESSYDDYVNAGIRATNQSYGQLTFTCKTIPTKNISVNIKAVSTKMMINGNRS